MESLYPAPVRAYALALTLRGRAAAYLCISDDRGDILRGGRLANLAGACGLPEDALVEQLLETLDALLPHRDRAPLVLPMVALSDEIAVDVHLFRAQGRSWVLLLDVSDDAATRRRAQQDGYDKELQLGRSEKIISRYLGGDLARFVVGSGSSVRDVAARRVLTILFADLRGFTSFCQGRPPDEIFGTLNAYIGVMIRAVHRHGGAVDKVIGDSVMAVYGLEDLGDDAPQRAVMAGVDILEGVSALGRQRASAGATRLEAGAGIATGPVMVGAVGTRARRALSVFGHPVNMASRLQGAAGAGELVIDAITRAAVRDALAWSDERLTLKGVSSIVAHRVRVA
ncbi:MAG: adenylate/guanylate cyclase domain-containing protein [Myxococcales bacterium]|nr:adenylate/guanylate cyclase domain-containing protein [Myxococcales bacterium]